MAIFVRVNPRQSVAKRFRCGIEFGSDFQQLDVDEATRSALEADPYLEVSDTAPAGFEAVDAKAESDTEDESNTETESNAETETAVAKKTAKKGAE